MSETDAPPATIDAPIGVSPEAELPELAIPPKNRPGVARRLVVMTDAPGPDLSLILSPEIERQLLCQVQLLTEAAASSNPRTLLRAADVVYAATECLEALVNGVPAGLGAVDKAEIELRRILALSGDEADGPDTLLACLNSARRYAQAALDALNSLRPTAPAAVAEQLG